MSELSKYSEEVTDFKILVKHDRQRFIAQLRENARKRRTILIIPLLATEFTDPENRPVFENILSQLSRIKYLYRIIFGLDGAKKKQANELRGLIKKYEIKRYLIQWNHGPVFSKLYKELSNAGFGFTEEGKGKNMFLSFGIAMAMDAHCVGLIDADIRNFQRDQLDRLLYPVVVQGYDFSKAYYNRVSGGRMYGRVKRLLLVPLLYALKRRFIESKDEDMLRLIDFLLTFHYPLSGEVAFDHGLLGRMRFATNWGVEIFTLIEVFRKAASAAQVEFTQTPFDHKHQIVSEDNQTKGLNRMSIDITTTLMRALVREEGMEITDSFFRDLSITYAGVAEQFIKKYSDQARFNNLDYDRDNEEHLVNDVFRNSILAAGEVLTSQARLTENFLKVIHSYPEFQPFVKAGLASAIMSVESKVDKSIFETPQTVSWERVTNKLPDIYARLRQIAKQEEERFA